MTVRITRRPTLVDGVSQAGRWWWRHWERFMEAGRGGDRGITAFTAEGAEDAEYGAAEEDVGYAVAEDARFRNLTGRSFLNFGYSASGQGASSSDTRLDDPIASNGDLKRRSTPGGVRRVPPASLILGASTGDARLDDRTASNADHAPQRMRRVEATKEYCPESLPPRRRSIAATRSVGSEGSVAERSPSAPPVPSAVKRSSTPTPTPDPEAVPCH